MAGLVIVMLLRVTGLSPRLPKKGQTAGQTAAADVEATASGSNRGGGPEASGGSTDAQRQTADDASGASAANGASAAAPVLWSSDSAAWFFSLHQVGEDNGELA